MTGASNPGAGSVGAAWDEVQADGGRDAALGLRRMAIVSPNFSPRVCGIGDYSARLGDELRRRGHEVAVFTRAPASRHPEAAALEVRAVPGRLPGVVAERTRRALLAWRPTDLLLQYTSQMWDAWRFGSLAPLWLAASARAAGVRVTLIVHELFVPFFRRPDLAVAAVVQRAQLVALLETCHRVFVTTDTRAAYLAPFCRALGLPTPGVLRVGANALPSASARSFERGPAVAPRLGVFSTAAVGKRFDVVLEAFARIAREVPRAELVLIGDLGPPERARVKDILDAARGHTAAARVRVTGRLSLPEIAAEIAALDVYLFPMSTGANTRSGTLPAALGSGLPVVAVQGPETDLALFRDGDNIVFARALDGQSFAAESLRLLDDPARMVRVGQGARRLYAEHLSWSRIVDHLLAEI